MEVKITENNNIEKGRIGEQIIEDNINKNIDIYKKIIRYESNYSKSISYRFYFKKFELRWILLSFIYIVFGDNAKLQNITITDR